MNCYCTSFKGVGGLIKQQADEFRVSEIIDPAVFNDLSSVQDQLHRYPLYILEKSNIDSNHAISQIKKRFGIPLKVIGLKDAKAITKQYATTEQLKNIPREIRTDQIFLTLKRFGSERSVTHLVGREIVRRNFKNAVELLLCYTSEYDSKTSREIREKSRDPHNYPRLLKLLPRGMDIECQLMSAILQGKDVIHALRVIPINMRRLFVQAYQAYIFNISLSTAIRNGENLLKGKEGDLCFEIGGSLVFGKIRKFNSISDSESNAV